MKTRQTWLDQWLDADNYPTRPVLFRHLDDIDRNGGLDEAVAAIRRRGWHPIISGRTLVALKSNRIELL